MRSPLPVLPACPGTGALPAAQGDLPSGQFPWAHTVPRSLPAVLGGTRPVHALRCGKSARRRRPGSPRFRRGCRGARRKSVRLVPRVWLSVPGERHILTARVWRTPHVSCVSRPGYHRLRGGHVHGTSNRTEDRRQDGGRGQAGDLGREAQAFSRQEVGAGHEGARQEVAASPPKTTAGQEVGHEEDRGEEDRAARQEGSPGQEGRREEGHAGQEGGPGQEGHRGQEDCGEEDGSCEEDRARQEGTPAKKAAAKKATPAAKPAPAKKSAPVKKSAAVKKAPVKKTAAAPAAKRRPRRHPRRRPRRRPRPRRRARQEAVRYDVAQARRQGRRDAVDRQGAQRGPRRAQRGP